jgi:L-alanine-DL-glutamate epimerase-like enolase superfamily enzyme
MTGRGFACVFGASGEAPYRAARQLVASEVAGRPLGHPEAFARRMRGALWRYGLPVAMAAADIALWDLYAKALDVPVGVAMGGEARAVPLYRTFEFGLSTEENCAQSQAAFDAGLAGVKLHVVASAEDERSIRAVAELADGRPVMLDSTRRVTLAQAIRIAGIAAEVGASWYEEPIAESDIGAYEALARAARVPIATGEALRSLSEAQTFLARGLCSVLQPDAFQMGGLTECLRAARAAEAFGIDVAPHLMPGLGAHLAAAAPNVTWLEQLPLIDSVLGGAPAFDASGRFSIGAAPGLGFRWNDALAKDFEIDG